MRERARERERERKREREREREREKRARLTQTARSCFGVESSHSIRSPDLNYHALENFFYSNLSNIKMVHAFLNSTQPHGGVRPFVRNSICITQSTGGPYVVQIWTRNTLTFRGNETRELQRVVSFVHREIHFRGTFLKMAQYSSSPSHSQTLWPDF